MSLWHKDVLRIVNPLNFTKILSSSPSLHPKTVLQSHERHNTIMWLSSPIDGKMTLFSLLASLRWAWPSPSLIIVWSNYQNCIHRLLWSLTSLKVSLSPKMFSKLRSQLSALAKIYASTPTSTHLIFNAMTRVTTCLENLEISGHLTAVREMSGISV